jgi:hypothetical protein
VSDRLLAIYLNDHLAGATGGTELARRARGQNRGTPLGEFLEQLTAEIEEDRNRLEQVMDELGVGRDRIKAVAAWGAEKLGRLKLNGQLLGYSPLSPLVELEALYIGITGKRQLWRALAQVLGPTFAGVDFAEMEARAERQLEGVERHRLELAEDAVARGE